jgi:DNA-directed RNA polymerase alpha subunit
MSDFIKVNFKNEYTIYVHKSTLRLEKNSCYKDGKKYFRYYCYSMHSFAEKILECFFRSKSNLNEREYQETYSNYRITREEYDRLCKELGVAEEEPLNSLLLMRIEELEFTVRTTNCLKALDIRFIGQLVQWTETRLLRTPNIGKKAITEIKSGLSANQLSLGTVILDWPRYEKELGVE